MAFGYEWDFSIGLHDFLVGISAIIGSVAVVFSGIKWLFDRFNKNTTKIKSILPYIRIGDTESYLPVKTQQEFSQIIQDAPLCILQVSSLVFIIRFNSVDKNESKIVYKSYFKPRLGIKWVFEILKEKNPMQLAERTNKIKSYLFSVCL